MPSRPDLAPRLSPAPNAGPARRRRLLPVALLAAAIAAAACVPSPSQEIAQAEMLLGISDAVVALREENAFLQDQVDSLHAAVARQDSLLRRVALMTGVPVGAP